MKGLMDTMVMGECIFSRLNTSLTVPPATLRNALPANPSMNLTCLVSVAMVWACRGAQEPTVNIVAALCPTAEGTSQIINMAHESRYIGRRP